MDPVQTDNEAVAEYKRLAEEKCREIYEDMKLHDFRIVEGNTHTNLIFDVVVPHGFKMSDSEIKAEIDSKIKKYDKKLFTVVTVDKDFAQVK